MKILISQDKVLDTIDNCLLNDISEYDREHLDTNIIYDIHEDFEGKKWCKMYSNKTKSIHNKDLLYDDLVKACISKGVFYIEITEIDASNQLTKDKDFLKKLINIEYKKLKAEVESELSHETIKAKDMFSKDLSPKTRKEIEEENRKYITSILEKSNRYINADLSKSNAEGKQDAALLVEDALRILYKHNRFYWSIIDSLNVCYTDNPAECPTLGVSINTLYINTKFIIKIAKSELVFILCHEALHIILEHHSRLLHRDSTLWNYAGDAIINLMLAEELKTNPDKAGPYAEFAHGGIYYPNLDLDHETTESVYDKILKGELPDLTNQIKQKLQKQGKQMPQLNNGNSGNSQDGEGEGQSGSNGGSQFGGNNSKSGNNQSKEERIKSILDKINSILDKINKNKEKPENSAVKAQVEQRLKQISSSINKVVDIISKKG